ncbi:MAG: response regulator [Anaerolineae bacterium]|nr:response regulator [Anaerolineae bacterium]
MEDYVLVVDDDPNVTTLVVDALSLFGLNAQFAVNGVDALKQIEQNPPKAIVLDLMMPGMDGFTTITRLQRNATIRHIPIIILSGIADASEQIKNLPGVVGVIRKGDFSIARLSLLLGQAGMLFTH